MLEGGAQHAVDFLETDIVQQEPLLTYGDVQLFFEGQPHGRRIHDPGHLLLQAAQSGGVGSHLLVAGIQFGHHLCLARVKQLLEHRLGRSERHHGLGIAVLHQLIDLLLQGGDVVRMFRLEIQFRFGGSQGLLPVQQVILPGHLGGLFHHVGCEAAHQFLHAAAVFVHMDILVPLYPHHQLVLVYLGHPFLVYEVEHEDAQGTDTTQKRTLMRLWAKTQSTPAS